jgi:hypothetical protein
VRNILEVASSSDSDVLLYVITRKLVYSIFIATNIAIPDLSLNTQEVSPVTLLTQGR